jgi:two-component system cell cycle response regulator CpdR
MAKILLAEDEMPVRELVRRALTQRGHTITAVADGAAALDALAQDSSYDLLLTDIVMPIMDGIVLALKCAKDYPKLRILMMTGYAAEKARAHNLDMLIHDVVLKPFTLDELNHRVDSALGTALARR